MSGPASEEDERYSSKLSKQKEPLSKRKKSIKEDMTNLIQLVSRENAEKSTNFKTQQAQ